RRAVPAGGNRVAAALVPVQSFEGVVLVAHRDGAAVGPDHAEAARGQSAGRARPRAVHHAAGTGAALLPCALATQPRTDRVRADRAALRALDPEPPAPACAEARRGLDPRAPQRRWR